MKQLPLLSLSRPTLREYVTEKLRDFKIRQQARNERRKRYNEMRKRPALPKIEQEEMFPECE